MGYLAGIECTYGMPEEDEREQNISLGQATDNSFKFVKFGNSKRILTIPLHGFSTANKELLQTAFEASVTKMFKLIPDDHIDLGGGAGTGVYAQMLDDVIDFQKTNHEKWSGEFTFAFGYAFFTPDDDEMYFKNNVEITGTYETPQTFTTNSGALATQENGQVFPEIYLGGYAVTIIVQSSDGTETTFGVKNVQQSGANISFEVYMSMAGRPKSSDGKFYANISISVKVIP
jgi:hypothetical protein